METTVSNQKRRRRNRDSEVPDSQEQRPRPDTPDRDVLEMEAEGFSAQSANNPSTSVRVELHTLPAAVRTQYQTMSEDGGDGDRVDSDRGDSDRGDSDRGDSDRGDSDRGDSDRGDSDRASDSESDEITIRKGQLRLNGLPDEMGNSFTRLVKRGPEMVRRTQKWVAEKRPPVGSLAEAQRLLPRPELSAAWTAKDRRKADEMWRKAAKTRLLKVGGNKDLLTLYKASLRMMRCLPEDIIGCRSNLEYDETQNRSMARGPRSLIWSSPFCKALTALLVHPMWGKSVAHLAAAIQYAVVVDTGDRGLDVELPEGDAFLQRLMQRRRQEPNRSITALRREAHDDMFARRERDVFGRETGSPGLLMWDLLFERLEKLAALEKSQAKKAGQAEQRTTQRKPPAPFKVHRRHLDLLIKALDTVTNMGFPVFMPVDLYNRGINGRRAAKDYPRQDQLHALREYGLQCEDERRRLKDKLRSDAAVSSAVVPHTQDLVPETQGRGAESFEDVEGDDGFGPEIDDGMGVPGDDDEDEDEHEGDDEPLLYEYTRGLKRRRLPQAVSSDGAGASSTERDPPKRPGDRSEIPPVSQSNATHSTLWSDRSEAGTDEDGSSCGLSALLRADTTLPPLRDAARGPKVGIVGRSQHSSFDAASANRDSADNDTTSCARSVHNAGAASNTGSDSFGSTYSESSYCPFEGEDTIDDPVPPGPPALCLGDA